MSYRYALACACGLAIASSAVAQMSPELSHEVPYPKDSGRLKDVGGPRLGGDVQRVWSTAINVPNAQWLRVHFSPETKLSGPNRWEGGSYLVITSALDGAQQVLDARSIGEWDHISAYLNGDTLLVELYAAAGQGDNHVQITHVTAGDDGNPETICGAVDDRVPDNRPSVGRLNTGCTGWLIAENGDANEFLTAGHCISNGQGGVVQMFQVPPATSTGGFVAPPPEFQFPVQSASIQSLNNAAVGDEYGRYNTNNNSNTGLPARIAQGRNAYTLASAAPTGGTATTTIYGNGIVNDQGGIPAVPEQWNYINKGATGAYAGKVGTRINYLTDTDNANSGSPVSQIIGSPIGFEQAIGIHTDGFCPGTFNSGTAIDHPGLQAALAAPAGVAFPYDSAVYKGLSTTFASDNGGNDNNAIYFDVLTGPASIEVNYINLNINRDGTTSNATATEDDDFFNFDVYTRQGTVVGNTTSMTGWTKVATGAGMPRPEDTGTLGALKNTFALAGSTHYGMAIVFTSGAAHRYTNGTGSNETYSNADLTIIGKSASSAAFGGTQFSPRVPNITLGYRLNEASGKCLETLYAQNNGGSNGGMIFFDVDVGPAALTLTGLHTNVEGVGGLNCDIKVYRAATTAVGKETNMALWTLIATGSAVSAPIGGPTYFPLDNFHTLSANTGYGIAIELTTSGGTEGHAYTNDTGLNGSYDNGDISFTAGSASNSPFGSNIADRVWNGSLCYGLGLGNICKDQLENQSPPLGSISPFNSNTTGQQEADDLVHATSDWKATGMTVWGSYSNLDQPPANQDFSVRFYSDSAGVPGSLLATRNVTNVTVKDTGIFIPAFNTSLQQFDITFASPVYLNQGKQWISVLGTEADNTWAWARTNLDTNAHAVRMDSASPWALSAGDFGFVLCGTIVPPCYADCEEDFDLDVFDFLCFQGEYASKTKYGDCEGDGDWDVFDFLCFQGKYAAGCTF